VHDKLQCDDVLSSCLTIFFMVKDSNYFLLLYLPTPPNSFPLLFSYNIKILLLLILFLFFLYFLFFVSLIVSLSHLLRAPLSIGKHNKIEHPTKLYKNQASSLHMRKGRLHFFFFFFNNMRRKKKTTMKGSLKTQKNPQYHYALWLRHS
jgi:hypothetical protein